MSRDIYRRNQARRHAEKSPRLSDDYGPVTDLFDVWESWGFSVDHISITRVSDILSVKEQWNYYRTGKATRGDIENLSLIGVPDADFDETGMHIERSYKERSRIWTPLDNSTEDYAPARDLILAWSGFGMNWRVKHIKVTAYLQKQVAKQMRKSGVAFEGGGWHYRTKKDS